MFEKLHNTNGVTWLCKFWYTNCLLWGTSRISTWASPFLNYINDFHNCSELLDFHLFADDANLSFKHKDINILESETNSELANLHIWLSDNKLSLNIEKSNFIIFRHTVVNFTCSFEVKAHVIHKTRAQTKLNNNVLN